MNIMAFLLLLLKEGKRKASSAQTMILSSPILNGEWVSPGMNGERVRMGMGAAQTREGEERIRKGRSGMNRGVCGNGVCENGEGMKKRVESGIRPVVSSGGESKSRNGAYRQV